MTTLNHVRLVDRYGPNHTCFLMPGDAIFGVSRFSTKHTLPNSSPVATFGQQPTLKIYSSTTASGTEQTKYREAFIGRL